MTGAEEAVVTQLTAAYPAITRCRVQMGGGEAHIEALLPQHQVIVNAAADDPARALAAALDRMRAQLAALVSRERTLRDLPKAA